MLKYRHMALPGVCDAGISNVLSGRFGTELIEVTNQSPLYRTIMAHKI